MEYSEDERRPAESAVSVCSSNEVITEHKLLEILLLAS
jgi:hypothetical protein